MRIFDLPIGWLCPGHLKAEHGELHLLWKNLRRYEKSWSMARAFCSGEPQVAKVGWSRHPEFQRWNRLGPLYLYMRHEAQARRMEELGITHKTPLPMEEHALPDGFTTVGLGLTVHIRWESIESQIENLKAKSGFQMHGKCNCLKLVDRNPPAYNAVEAMMRVYEEIAGEPGQGWTIDVDYRRGEDGVIRPFHSFGKTPGWTWEDGEPGKVVTPDPSTIKI
jgi:hypothetical protein